MYVHVGVIIIVKKYMYSIRTCTYYSMYTCTCVLITVHVQVCTCKCIIHVHVTYYMYNAREHHFYVHVHTCIIHTTCTCTYMYTRGIIISTCIHVHVVPDLIKFTYYDGSYTLIR